MIEDADEGKENESSQQQSGFKSKFKRNMKINGPKMQRLNFSNSEE